MDWRPITWVALGALLLIVFHDMAVSTFLTAISDYSTPAATSVHPVVLPETRLPGAASQAGQRIHAASQVIAKTGNLPWKFGEKSKLPQWLLSGPSHTALTSAIILSALALISLNAIKLWKKKTSATTSSSSLATMLAFVGENTVILSGYVWQNPDFWMYQDHMGQKRYFATFMLSTTQQDGRQVWHKMTVLSPALLSSVQSMVRAGSLLRVVGTLQYRPFLDQQNFERMEAEILVSTVEPLGIPQTQPYSPQPVPPPNFPNAASMNYGTPNAGFPPNSAAMGGPMPLSNPMPGAGQMAAPAMPRTVYPNSSAAPETMMPNTHSAMADQVPPLSASRGTTPTGAAMESSVKVPSGQQEDAMEEDESAFDAKAPSGNSALGGTGAFADAQRLSLPVKPIGGDEYDRIFA